MQQYASLTTLCEIYELSEDFFRDRKADGTFEQNIHFIQQGRMVRWDIEAIDRWWRSDDPANCDIDDIISRIVPA